MVPWMKESITPPPHAVGVSARQQSGNFELRLGVKLRDLTHQHAGGVIGGRPIKAIIPGGVSMSVLRGDQIDVAMDHENRAARGRTLVGTAGIVMDDRTCMVRTALVVARFSSTSRVASAPSAVRAPAGHIRPAPDQAARRVRDLQTLADTFDFMDGKCDSAADGGVMGARISQTVSRRL
jgi:NADH:ubiquinone oxidoreductase subunit F (NADH-binding)